MAGRTRRPPPVLVLAAMRLYPPHRTCTHHIALVLTTSYLYSPHRTCTHHITLVLTSSHCTHRITLVLTTSHLYSPRRTCTHRVVLGLRRGGQQHAPGRRHEGRRVRSELLLVFERIQRATLADLRAKLFQHAGLLVLLLQTNKDK